MPRNRISLAKENRIRDLLDQGYPTDIVASIVNLPVPSVYTASRRIRNRWKHEGDPRLGRRLEFLNDQDICNIRRLRAMGWTYHRIGQEFYGLTGTSVYAICSGRTYQEPCFDGTGYDFSKNFINRWRSG